MVISNSAKSRPRVVVAGATGRGGRAGLALLTSRPAAAVAPAAGLVAAVAVAAATVVAAAAAAAPVAARARPSVEIAALAFGGVPALAGA